MRILRASLVPLFTALLASACGETKATSPQLQQSAGSGGATGEWGCGNKLGGNQLRSNIYFVVDRSGSQSALIDETHKRYDVLTASLKDLVRLLGPNSNFAAAVYPGDDKCGTGMPVMELSQGDPQEHIIMGTYGPTANAFFAAINVPTQGSTPTTKTLLAIKPKLMTLGPNTFVLLATDGGPNCTMSDTCPITECTLNVDMANAICTSKFNCCDPKNGAEFSGSFCLDKLGTAEAVKMLADSGIRTIVVGIPGTAAYADVLDSVAEAGGFVNKKGPRKYYSPNSVQDFSTLFAQIAEEVPPLCGIQLFSEPEEPTKVNVYFDGEIVPQSATDGWTFNTSDPRVIDFHGPACDAIKQHTVMKAWATTGCDTVTSK